MVIFVSSHKVELATIQSNMRLAVLFGSHICALCALPINPKENLEKSENLLKTEKKYRNT